MLFLLSPAKSLNFSQPERDPQVTQPMFLEHSQVLIDALRRLAPSDLANLMSISDALALLNYNRFADWSLPFNPDNAKAAVMAFDGDVYDGLSANTLDAAGLAYAQAHVGILSGLYGLLRPLDLIQAYRLEMGTKFANPRGKDLYAFWAGLITDYVNQRLAEMSAPVVINLASEEYFKSVQSKKLQGRVIQPVFEDWKSGKFKIISFYAKRARGLMTRYAIDHNITDPEALKSFDVDGYAFEAGASERDMWVFRRKAI